MASEYLEAPVDASSERVLRERGLELALVAQDPAEFEAWIQVVARGFLDSERTPEQVDAARARSVYRRKTVVRDAEAAQPERPVGTIASWPAELTLPGGATIPAGAISSVTVAPTHRRRGIARAMLEGELRFLMREGVPVATLTVSESTLYGRYGFGLAASVAELTIEARRAGWAGPDPAGRIDFIPRATLRALAPEIHDRMRRSVPGELDVPSTHWDTLSGTAPDAKDPGRLRAIQYRSTDGAVEGVALYSVRENHDDFTKARADVVYLLAESDDAFAALWRFLLSLDLVSEVTAHEQPVDSPLLWMIVDRRAASVQLRDHHYLRILDVERVLGARTYSAPGRFRLSVSDPIGLSDGEYLLRVDDAGAAEVSRATGEDDSDTVHVSLGITELSALLLGGVSPEVLGATGRLRTPDAAALGRTFSWHRAPRLSFWY